MWSGTTSKHFCRICRDEGSTDTPIYAPCRCTGSIRHVHQSCLQQWLEHSGKGTCELCGHRFVFSPVYSKEMPPLVPLGVVVGGIVRHVAQALRRVVRVGLVGCLWLVAVPMAVQVFWRTLFYFAGGFGQKSFLGIMGHEPVNTTSAVVALLNGEAAIVNRVLPAWALRGVFEGQMLCVLSFVLAIGVFMLREALVSIGLHIMKERQRKPVRVAHTSGDYANLIPSEARRTTGPMLDRLTNIDEVQQLGLVGAHEAEDFDDDIAVSFEILETLGFRGPWQNAVNSVLVALASFACVIFATQFIPFLVGRLVLVFHPFKYFVSVLLAIQGAVDLVCDKMFDSVITLTPAHNGRILEYLSTSHTIAGIIWYDRLFVIIVGYLTLFLSAFSYVLVLRRSNVYALAALHLCVKLFDWFCVACKVIFFMAIEMCVIPAYCGGLTCLFSSLLFPPFLGIFTALSRTPTVAVFMLWLMGTGFMFHLASLVNVARQSLRAGVLWFIRDPSDPSFSPIREIVNRSFTCHLRKFVYSLFLYLFIISFTFGVFCLILYSMPLFLPLSLRQTPFSDIPLDLMLVPIVFSACVNTARLRDILKGLFLRCFKISSAIFRMHCYLFGEFSQVELLERDGISGCFSLLVMRLKELKFDKPMSVPPIERRPHPMLQKYLDFEDKEIAENWEDTNYGHITGRMYRVPGYDAIVVVPGREMIVEVNRLGEIEDKSRLDAIAMEDTKSHWTFAYLPPNFRIRCLLMMILLGCFFAVVCSLSVAVPILVGRYLLSRNATQSLSLFEMLTTSVNLSVHDFYSALVGLVVCLTTFSLFKLRSQDVQRPGLAPLWRWAYVAMFLFVFFPISLSMFFNRYVWAPVHVTLAKVLERHYFTEWIYSTFVLKIIYHLMCTLRPSPIVEAIRTLNRRGWREIQLGVFNKHVVKPYFALFVVLFAVPPLLPDLNYKYPFYLCFLALLLTLHKCVQAFVCWLNTIRDEAYLIERVLIDLPEEARRN